MRTLADALGPLPPGVEPRPVPTPPWLVEKIAHMERWADGHLSGWRREYFREHVERVRRAGVHGCHLVRLKGTPNPWDMNTSNEVALSVYYYEVPIESDEDYMWRSIFSGMERDDRLTRELAERMLENARGIPSANPDRLRRLQNLFTARFKTNAPRAQARTQRWQQVDDSEFAIPFDNE